MVKIPWGSLGHYFPLWVPLHGAGSIKYLHTEERLLARRVIITAYLINILELI